MLQNEVTKENLNNLVISFYAKVLKDDLIGPIFIDTLGKDLKGEVWFLSRSKNIAGNFIRNLNIT